MGLCFMFSGGGAKTPYAPGAGGKGVQLINAHALL